MAPRTVAQQIAPVKVATYDEKFELFTGLSLMNGQAGQNLPKRYNMGGGEVMGTYWLGARLGVAADYRLGAGTTDIFPQTPLANTRALVFQNIISGGVNFRGPKNRYAAVDLHALAGASRGTFDHSIQDDPAIPPSERDPVSPYGLYRNGTTPWGAVGGSIDFNIKPKLAVRLSPDMIFEHFGTENARILRDRWRRGVAAGYAAVSKAAIFSKNIEGSDFGSLPSMFRTVAVTPVPLPAFCP